MARNAGQITPGWPAALAMLGVASVTLGPLAAVAVRAGGFGTLAAADWAALRFTLTQSTLSAVISVGLAVPLARGLARRDFPGRRPLVVLLGAPFILPVIVAVLGLLAVFGRNGLLNDLMALIGLPRMSIYGLHGVVLAHVFFNLPLATRILLQGWQSIPAERFRLAASLGMGPGEVMRFLEWPMLRIVGPGALMIVFAICLSSFTVALTLGGGPAATTVELAIYQAFRFDFDLGHAAALAMVQLCLVTVAAILALRLTSTDGLGAGMDRVVQRWDAGARRLKLQDAALLAGAALFLLLPMGMILLSGLDGLAALSASVWRATLVSIGVALVATALTMIWAVALATGRGSLPQLLGTSALAASPLVIGTGAFILLMPWTAPQAWALPVTAVVNALMALPFALRVIVPDTRAVEQNFGRLSDSLGLTGWTKMRIVVLPRIKRPLGFAAGLTAALSMGDLGVIALFADPERATLPLQMYRLMGAYRMEAAAGAGLILVSLSLLMFYAFDRGGRGDADT